MAKTKYSEFAAALDTAASLDGTEEVVILQDGLPVQTTTQDIADLGGGAAGYLIYAALLTQAGTDAPVATVLQNTLGGTVVWSYNGVGDYSATLSGAFTEDKTACFVTPTNYDGNGVIVGFGRKTANDCYMYVNAVAGGASELGTNGDVVTVEIRVYP